MATRHPDPRLARLLQPAPAPARDSTIDLVIDLARVRAAASTMASALGEIAITSGDVALTRTAEEALDRAVQMLS